MALTLSNQYTAQLSAVIMFWSPDTCGGEGENYQMIGWYNLEPGASGVVYENSVDGTGQYWYLYAQAVDGAVWNGPGSWLASVPSYAFNQCYGVGVSIQNGDEEAVELDFFELVVDTSNLTVNFTS